MTDEPLKGEVVRQYEMSQDGQYRKGYIVEEWTDEQNRRLARYESGMIRNLDNNTIVKPVDKPFFNKDNALDMVRLRKEKTARKIRDEISRAMFGKEITKNSAESVGIAAGMLWTEIVMNKEALARDRINAWVALGKHAGLLTDLRENEIAPEGVKVEIGQNLAREIVQKIMDRRNKDV
jgi:hypothetical protein